jgi:epoxyqueuosine reductase
VNQLELAELVKSSIRSDLAEVKLATEYREPLVGFASAKDPRFPELRRVVDPAHSMPDELLPGAQSVLSFFLPFAEWIVEANAQHRHKVAREWAVAYLETNALIRRTAEQLVEQLSQYGIRAFSEPPTHTYDPTTLVARWSHKSVAVIAGLGSFGLHQMVITDSGCAGRFGSLVTDVELEIVPPPVKQRCLYFHDGSCRECVDRCPVSALTIDRPIDKQLCNRRLLSAVREDEPSGLADVCGKCVIGPCSFQSAVH